uniref:Uncharacterized protein n=1 Tax=Leersia perrieri TaxID=77586 RepID=A0A0D9WQM9_9ORYZ
MIKEGVDDDSDLSKRRCSSIGEAVRMFSGNKFTQETIADWFQCFIGLDDDTQIWFAYDDADNFNVNNQEKSVALPSQSRSGHPIKNSEVLSAPNLGADAPLPMSYMKDLPRELVTKATKKRRDSTSARLTTSQAEAKKKKLVAHQPQTPNTSTDDGDDEVDAAAAMIF